MPYKANEPRRHKIPPGALPGSELAGVRQGTPAARQPHSLGHAGGARGLASAPDWPEGPTPRLLGRGNRDWAPAAPGLWSALAADRRPAALAHDAARGEPRCARPYDLLPAQPWPGTRYGAGAGPGERAGSRRDRRHGPEGLRRGRVAGGEARCARQADLAETPPRRRSQHRRDARVRADEQRGGGRLPGRPAARADP